MFICFLPCGGSRYAELHTGGKDGNPVVIDGDTLVQLDDMSRHCNAKYWLGALVSKRWGQMKLSEGEQQAIKLVVETLKK